MSSDLKTIIPGQHVPDLLVPLAGGGVFDMARSRSDFMLLVVFYRGAHCPQCRRQLQELEARVPDLESRNVSVAAISADTPERAVEAKETWQLERIRLGHSLPLGVAREWGLFVSTGRGRTSTGHEEPRLFTEPGLFLIAPDNTLYASQIQSYPFARPRVDDIVVGLDFIARTNYPPRGDVKRL